MRHHLSVQFDYSPREFVQALDETPHRRRLKKWWVPGSVAVVSVLVALQAIRRDLFDGPPNALFWFGMVGVVPLFVSLLLTPTILRHLEIRRHRSTGATARETRQFGEDGMSHGDRAPRIPWSMITRVVESENFYLFFDVRSDLADYVPKRALEPSDVVALRALLQGQFHTRTGDLQLMPPTMNDSLGTSAADER